jgi:oxygen-dependent protoporphyrinogen oxidase
VVSLARADLARALGRADAPAPRVTHTVEWKDAIPQYVVGHARRVEALERELAERCPGLHLAGSWVAGVGVEHVLARGRAVARELLREARVA